MTQSQVNVSKLYQSVIEDVMAGIRESFLDEGVDEQVLQELRMLWESKLVSSKTYDPINSTTESTTPSAAATNSNNGSVPNQKGPSSSSNNQPPQQQQQQQQQTVLPTDPNAPVSIQIAMPRQVTDPLGVQKTITIHVPASCIHTNKLQDILTLPTVQATLSLPAELAASTLQAQVNQALQSVQGDLGMMQKHPSVITSHQMQSNAMSNIVQLDGQTAGGDSSEDEDEEDDDDDDLDDDVDDKDDDREDEQEDEGQDEEPLNSGDDVSDAADSNDKLYEIDNVVVCQYDKITRTRNKWKFHLKDGIMNLNGKDYVFQKANGDAEW